MDSTQSKPDMHRPRVVIIGSGFAGLSAAKGLASCSADVILIDRSNHHVFQPLLYQVATAALSPAQIAQPIRTILKNQANCTVELHEITGVDVKHKVIKGNGTEIPYDYLVIATGATHTYFNHDEWSPYAPGLKSIEDALKIRRLILNAFEKAEVSQDPEDRKALMTFILIGGGPTGVEMAGAIAELARHTLTGEFRHINPMDARVILVEASASILPSFPDTLSARSQKDLENLGVEVITGQSVTECNETGARIDSLFILCHTIIWCAGVKASAAGHWLQVEQDQTGRVIVNHELSVPDYPDIFVIGDTAHVIDKNGITVPGLCPAAVQQGNYVARLLNSKIHGQSHPEPFAYTDRGIMATIGRGKAVVDIQYLKITGLLAWMMWGVIHLIPLVGFRNRFVVGLDWFWSYLTKDRGVRLITSGQKTDL